ncbi:MAG: hypothetical protein IJO37_05215 [Ruminiclostridium sp.]|nr:hypothetical protein [Ruminiclostridium sp.]
MKKLIAILLSLTFILSVSVFAATINNPGTSREDVTVTYQSSASDVTVYSVDIEWGSMDFSYTVSDRTWNPSSHSYSGGTGKWSCATGANIVTITNHSNSDINCKFEFSSTNDNVQGNFSTDTINIASAEGYEYNADTLKATSTLSLSGTIKDATEAGTIGTASVTISASE